MLKQSPRDIQDMEIEDSLLNERALRSKSIYPFDRDPDQTEIAQLSHEAPTSPLLVVQKTPSKNRPPARKKESQISSHRSSLIVVASLMGTVAFQAAITPPGGVWQNDLTEDENGQPVKEPHYAGISYSLSYDDQIGLYVNTRAMLAYPSFSEGIRLL